LGDPGSISLPFWFDKRGRSCTYVPITQNGKVVDSKGFVLDADE